MDWKTMWEKAKLCEGKVSEPLECCCCCGPRKAAYYVAIFNYIAYSLHIVHMSIYYTSNYHDYLGYCHHRTNIDLDRCAVIMMWFVWGTVTTSIITLGFNCLLMQGVRRCDPKLVWIYLAYKVAHMFYYGTIMAGFLFYLLLQHVGWLYIIIIVAPLGIFWDVYFFLLVRVFYRKMLYPEQYVKPEEETLEELRAFSYDDYFAGNYPDEEE